MLLHKFYKQSKRDGKCTQVFFGLINFYGNITLKAIEKIEH